MFAAICAILVCRPCPISTPPCWTTTVPSAMLMLTRALEAFSDPRGSVNEIPYLCGIMAIPRLRQRFDRLNASTASARASKSDDRYRSSQISRMLQKNRSCPKWVRAKPAREPLGYRFFRRISSGRTQRPSV